MNDEGSDARFRRAVVDAYHAVRRLYPTWPRSKAWDVMLAALTPERRARVAKLIATGTLRRIT